MADAFRYASKNEFPTEFDFDWAPILVLAINSFRLNRQEINYEHEKFHSKLILRLGECISMCVGKMPGRICFRLNVQARFVNSFRFKRQEINYERKKKNKYAKFKVMLHTYHMITVVPAAANACKELQKRAIPGICCARCSYSGS